MHTSIHSRDDGISVQPSIHRLGVMKRKRYKFDQSASCINPAIVPTVPSAAPKATKPRVEAMVRAFFARRRDGVVEVSSMVLSNSSGKQRLSLVVGVIGPDEQWLIEEVVDSGVENVVTVLF